MYDGSVRIKINGDDTNFRKAIESTSTSLNGLKSLIVKLGLGAVFAKGIKEGITASNALENSVAKASTLFGSVEVNVGSLEEKIKALSNTTGISADKIGNSLYNALSAGVEVTEDMGDSMEFMEANAKLAIAGFTDIDNAVQATAKVLNAYGKDVIDIDTVSKVLMTTQNLGITTVDQLGGALATVTPVASAFGLSFEQVGASLAVMTKAGTDTNTATTQLRATLNALAQSDTKASKALAEASKKATGQAMSFKELNEAGYTLQEMLRMMQDYAKDTGVSLMDLFGDVRSGTGALQIASDATATYNRFLEEMGNDADIVQEAYDKVMGTRSKTWEQLANRLKNISINITNSETIQGILDSLTSKAEQMIGKMEEWLPDMIESLDAFYHKVRIVFKYIEGEYERSFLKKGVDIAIHVISDELKGIIEKFNNGDLLGSALQLGTDMYLLKVGFKVMESTLVSLTGAVGTAFKGIGWGTLVADGLLIYLRFKEAMQENDWSEFAGEMIGALLAGLLTTGLTGSVSAGALVFGVSFKLLGWLNDKPNTVAEKAKAEAQKDPNKAIGNSLLGKVGSEAEKAIKEDVQTVGELSRELDQIEQTIVNKTLTVQERLVELRKTATGKAVLESLTDASDTEIKEWSTFYASTILNAFRNALDMQDIGGYVTEGLAKGMTGQEAKKTLTEASKTVAGIADSTLEEEEEIHSPSKVWERYGEYLAEGLAKGLSGTQAENFAEEAVEKLYAVLEEEVKEGNVGLEEAFKASDFLRNATKNMASALNTGTSPATSSTGIKAEVLTAPVAIPEPSKGAEFFDAMAKSMGLVIGESGKLSEWFTNLTDQEGALTEKGQFWADTLNGALQTAFSGFEQLGEALIDGEASWGIFAKAGLQALASIVEAIAYQLLGQAVASYPNFAQMAKAGAMSAVMLTGAGLIRGWANQFEKGGIVGGSGYTGDKHMIWANAGELILNRAQQKNLAGQLGSSGGGNVIHIDFSGNVFGDQQSIAEYVYEGIRTAQHNGVIGSWQ